MVNHAVLEPANIRDRHLGGAGRIVELLLRTGVDL